MKPAGLGAISGFCLLASISATAAVAQETRFDTPSTVRETWNTVPLRESYENNLEFFSRGASDSADCVHPPGAEAFLDHLTEILAESIAILKQRPEIDADVISDVLGAEWRTAYAEKTGAYTLICSAIARVEGLRQNDQSTHLIEQAEAHLSFYENKYGRDPRAHYQAIASSYRPEPIHPSFEVGAVVIDVSRQTDALTDAADRLRQARLAMRPGEGALRAAREKLEAAEEAFWETVAEQQTRLAPLEDAYQAAMDPLVRRELARVERQQIAVGERAAEVARLRARARTIEERLALPDEIYGTPENARRQKAQLSRELNRLNARFAGLAQALEIKSEDALRRSSPRAQEVYADMQLAQRDAERITDRAGRDLEMAEAGYDRAKTQLEKAEEELQAAITGWAEAQDNAAIEIAQISSHDFRILFNPDLEDLQTINDLVADLRASLAEATRTQRQSRRSLRQQMGELAAVTDSVNLAAAQSILLQAGLDAASQLVGMGKAYRSGGPFAAVTDGALKTLFNLYNPPGFYGLTQGADKTPGAVDGAGKQLVSKGEDLVKRGVTYLPKSVTGLLDQEVIRREIEGVFGEISAFENGFASLGRSEASRVAAQVREQTERLAELRKNTDTLLDLGNRKDLAKLIGQDMVMSELENMAVDLGKRNIALWLESDAANRMLLAEAKLGQAAMLHRAAGLTVRRLRNELRELEGERDRLLEGLDPTQTARVERNRQFVPVDGYAFELFSVRDAAAGNAEKSRITAKVFLQDVELERVETEFGARFEIRDASVFDSAYPVGLTLRVDTN